MPNIPDLSPEEELSNREIVSLIRDLINARPGINRLVTSIAIDASESAADVAVVVIRVSRDAVGVGGGNNAVFADGASPGNIKSKIVGDETFSESDGHGANDMVGQPAGVVEE